MKTELEVLKHMYLWFLVNASAVNAPSDVYRLRIRSQGELALMRDRIAFSMGMSSQYIQDTFESLAHEIIRRGGERPWDAWLATDPDMP